MGRSVLNLYLFLSLRSLFSTEEIADLVVTTAWHHLCAVILNSLEAER